MSEPRSDLPTVPVTAPAYSIAMERAIPLHDVWLTGQVTADGHRGVAIQALVELAHCEPFEADELLRGKVTRVRTTVDTETANRLGMHLQHLGVGNIVLPTAGQPPDPDPRFDEWFVPSVTDRRPLLWNPTALLVSGLVLTPVFVTWLLHRNWVTLGYRAGARRMLRWHWFSMAGVITVMALGPLAAASLSQSSILAVDGLQIAAYAVCNVMVSREQRTVVDHLPVGYRRKGFLAPVIVMCVALFISSWFIARSFFHGQG